MGRFSLFGIALIVAGSMMLLDTVGVIRLGWVPILWTLLAVVGAVRMIDGFSRRKSGRVFWGTFFFLSGVYGALCYLDFVDLRSYWMFPVMMVIVGLSAVMTFVSSPRNWPLLIPALLFLGTGSVLILYDLGYVYEYDLKNALRIYWPIGIILFGVALIVRGIVLHVRAPKVIGAKPL